MSAGQFSYESLLQFMDWMIGKGMVNKQTGSSWKTAAQKVLESLDPSEVEDLRSLDRDSAFTRFQNLNKSRYTPDSLKVYRNRFSAALDNFLSHTSDPSGFKPSVGQKKPGQTTTNGPRNSKRKKAATKASVSLVAPSPSATDVHIHSGTEASLTLPIPLRPGVLVKVFGLPSDLSEEEARKICAVVTAYVTPK